MNREKPTDYIELFKTLKEPQLEVNIIVNDFEEVAFAMHPILFSLKRSLYDCGAEFALMSGSGSAFFAIFKNQFMVNKAREKLLTDYPETSVFISQ
jgi:4-diphosphocytidyl-2-C-methyl-D-erythritol kinase